MSVQWQSVTAEEYANFERLLEEHVISVNGMFWRRVRPLFYRPLVSFKEYPPDSAQAPLLSSFGGFQHAVPSVQDANSFLNFLMFQNAQNYAIDQLDYNRKRQVKRAAKEFVVRPITNLNEFKESAYPVYLSFYERTQYRYGSQRRSQDYFFHWADALFRMPKVVVLGGYRGGILGGVSVSLLIENTVHYAMFFCDTESLRLGLSDFMLHSVREAVAIGQCAGRVFVGMYKGGNSLDEFYLLRGCTLIKQPAFLQLNPVTDLFLKRILPGRYNQLKGEVTQADSRRANIKKPTSEDPIPNHGCLTPPHEGASSEAGAQTPKSPHSGAAATVKAHHPKSRKATRSIAISTSD